MVLVPLAHLLVVRGKLAHHFRHIAGAQLHLLLLVVAQGAKGVTKTLPGAAAVRALQQGANKLVAAGIWVVQSTHQLQHGFLRHGGTVARAPGGAQGTAIGGYAGGACTTAQAGACGGRCRGQGAASGGQGA
jgi:hypothetical protein